MKTLKPHTLSSVRRLMETSVLVQPRSIQLRWAWLLPFVFVTSTAFGQPLPSSSPMWGVDANNSRQSPNIIPIDAPTIAWQKTSLDVHSGTAMTTDGQGGLFIPSGAFRRLMESGDPDPSVSSIVSRDSTAAHDINGQTYLWVNGRFEARNTKTGDLLWTGLPSNASDGLPPKIGSDGTIYAPKIQGQIVAYSPTGQLIYESDEYGVSSAGIGRVPAVDADSNVYFSVADGIVSLDSGGNERWSVPGPTNGTVILGPDGLLYHTGSVRTNVDILTVRNPLTGEVVREIQGARRLEAISSQGTAYVLNSFTGLKALNLDGSEKWRFDRFGLNFNSVVVDAENKVLVSDSDNIIALSASGAVLWEVGLPTVSSQIPHPPIILDDGRIVVQKGSTLALLDPEPSVFTTLLPLGSLWSYLDNGTNQGATWRNSDFDDSAWDAGLAQLGYGDGDEATVVNCGPDAPRCDSGNSATTYFRHTFEVENADRVESLTAVILRDDAAAVYLNGIEIFRDDNLPRNAASNTFATSTGEENGMNTFVVEPVLLVDGENVLAVEVHQRSSTSSDISFDFRLTGTVNAIPEPTTLMLAAFGLFGLVARRRRRRTR